MSYLHVRIYAYIYIYFCICGPCVSWQLPKMKKESGNKEETRWVGVVLPIAVLTAHWLAVKWNLLRGAGREKRINISRKSHRYRYAADSGTDTDICVYVSWCVSSFKDMWESAWSCCNKYVSNSPTYHYCLLKTPKSAPRYIKVEPYG